MRKELEARVGRAIEERIFPGCAIGVVRASGEREIMPFGRFTYERGSPAVAEDTVYDMASVTKSIPLASLVLLFASEEKLSLMDAVTKHIPELQNDFGATIEDLLTYRVQGPRLSTLGYKTGEEIRTYVLGQGFEGPPGKGRYTNLPAFLLGMVVERVGGALLPALADTNFFGPLGMKNTTFFPHDAARVAPTEIIDGEEIRGVVHDESARVFARVPPTAERAQKAVGHAGLFSTAPDMLNFLGALLQGKFPAVTDGAQKGLGWQFAQPWFMGSRCGERTFGKTGFTGTSVVCDIERGIAFVILSNRTYPKRPPDAASIHAAINGFRADIADVVFG